MDTTIMGADIIRHIINKANGVENLFITIQDSETEKEYRDRIYTKGNDLFMQSVTELGLCTLDEEDVALYDELRGEVILDIAFMLIFGEIPMGFSY